ncbi:putative nwd2 protein [Mycena venus]|uniref:Putative nwd2 protein n=1 Tax=Mycena venus TaxID=2733690 RepID=A0A8H7C957_9AGAR|nr:putative nwd2 protein [Mycena venus]
MSRWVNESQTIHNYISGGVGGNGGEGHEQGTGGGGGAGEGPTVTTTIEAVTVHLNQNHHLGGAWLSRSGQHGRFEGASRELPGPTRSHQRRVGWTPYDLASRTLSRRGFNEESTASQHASSLTQSMSGLQSARATSHTSSGSFSAPYRFDPQFAHPVDHYPRNQADRVGFSTPSHQNYHPDWVGDDTFPAFERHQIPEPSQPIHAPTFITAETLNHHPGEAGINILHKAAALEALYDSADSYPQPRCHPETRTELLDTLYQWAVQHDSACSVRWLHGPAGAGKSAIMQTLCQKLQTAGRLGGAFFFKRDHLSRGNAKVLFATLAYQLAINNDTLKSAICQTVEYDPSVVARSMDAQLRQLIVEPCHLLTNRSHAILLIDGLDECQNEGTHQEILRLIKTAVIAKRPSETFRFLIASRPETHIREIIEDPAVIGIVDSLNVNKSFEDVRKFFRDQFSRIHLEHRTMVNIPTPWPSRRILDHLVEKSSGYFIYASTVIKFIDDRDFRPTQRLALIQTLSPTDSDAPFAALDQLYTQILSGVPARFRSILRDILQCTVVVNLYLTPAQLDRLFDLEPGDVELILHRLHSVLEVPSDSAAISVHHASFLDFLRDQRRSSVFHISPENGMNVARAVIKALSDDNHWLDTPENPLAWGVTLFHIKVHCLILACAGASAENI